MSKHEVYGRTARSKIPKLHRCVKSKWVFKIKRDGRFRACLVACGYSQIPGVDFVENFSPVINDVTLRILVALFLVNKYKAKIIDVKTLFLYGDLEEEVYMEVPPGLKNGKDAIMRLNKCIYGLVQASRQ